MGRGDVIAVGGSGETGHRYAGGTEGARGDFRRQRPDHHHDSIGFVALVQAAEEVLAIWRESHAEDVA